jgi:hypothetical protein
MLISTALLLDSIIRNRVCTPAKLPYRGVEVVYDLNVITFITDIYCSFNLVVGRKILLDIVSD